MTIFCAECGAKINTMFTESSTASGICESCEKEQQREYEDWLNSDECEVDAMIEKTMREDAE